MSTLAQSERFQKLRSWLTLKPAFSRPHLDAVEIVLDRDSGDGWRPPVKGYHIKTVSLYEKQQLFPLKSADGLNLQFTDDMYEMLCCVFSGDKSWEQIGVSERLVLSSSRKTFCVENIDPGVSLAAGVAEGSNTGMFYAAEFIFYTRIDNQVACSKADAMAHTLNSYLVSHLSALKEELVRREL